MPIEHTIETVYKSKEHTGRKTSAKVLADGAVNREVNIPAGAQDLRITCPIDVSEIKGLNIGCDKGALAIKTNSTSTPADELTIDNKLDIIWTPASPTPCPLTTDVTDFYVSNNGDTDALFYVQAAVDATPAIQ
jgi:hypothetical protein